MPQYTLKDLPDTSKLQDEKSYTLKGKSLKAMIELHGLLWRGENIGNSSTVKKNANGDSGFQLTAAQQSAQALAAAAGVTVFALQPAGATSTHSSPKVAITYGTYAGFVPTISGTALVTATSSNIITLSPSDQVVYMQCDFTYTGSSPTITDAEIMSATNTAFAALTSTAASGSGTVYQILFGVTITAPVGSGPYTVTAAPAVGGSQNFGVCIGTGSGDSINGPWGV